MKMTISSILRLFKLLVAFVAIYAVIFSPLLQSYGSIEALNYELVDIEEQSDKNEEQIDNEDKVELYFLSFYDNTYNAIHHIDVTSNQVSRRDFILEISIPPPEMV